MATKFDKREVMAALLPALKPLVDGDGCPIADADAGR